MKKKISTSSLFCGALLLLTSNNINAQCGVNAVPPNSSGCQFGDRIDFFSINSVASPFSAGCSPAGYGTYTTAPTWTITAGASTSFSANVGGGSLQQGFGIWIDLNKDGIYNNTNEQVFNNDAFLVHANTFTLPISVITGTYNLRARCSYGNTQTSACDAIIYGEAENYIVQINGQGAALKFDGTDDYVTTGTAITNALLGSNKITVEAWVNPGNLTGIGTIVGNYNAPTNNSQMQFLLRRNGSNYEYYIGNGIGGSFSAVNSAPGTATANVWQHVSGTWDGAVAKVYVNGVLSNTATIAYPAFTTFTNQVWIGGRSGSEYFNGSIDEVKIWNRVLCQPEIQNNMMGQLTLLQTNLQGYYQFNQGIANSANPTTTLVTALAGPTGTVQNMALTGATSNWIAPGGVISTSTVTPFLTPTISIAGATSICSGSSTTFTASGVSTYSWTSGPTTATFVVTPTVTATYSVVGTASNGCVSNMATKSITVNATPTVAVNSGSICSGNTFTIIPSGANTYTVQGGSSAVTPTVNTSYTVIGTSAAGCVSSNTATSSVTVNALPTVLATTSNTLICAGQTATLTASGATTYTWNTAETTTGIAVSPTVTTTFTVNGTDANGCSNTSTLTQNVSLCTGIASLTNSEASINVYPNPSNGLFVIELTTASKVILTNALGQVVFAETFDAGKHNVNIFSEATGIYFVKVMANDKHQIIKVIKE